MKAYLVRHLQVLFATLGDMGRSPLITLTTVFIIGISLLLPTLMYIVVKSALDVSATWQGQPQLSVFFQPELDQDEAQLIFEELRLHPAIELAEMISPEDALAEFKTLSGLDFELEFLDRNPLPASIVILPQDSYRNSADLATLRDELGKIDGIEDIQLDLEWTNRFNSLLASFSQAAKIVSLVLAVALVLIVGITIRLLILNRRNEIVITKLVGGSDRFVRRPFLYFGSLFGLFGALITLLLLLLVGHLMEPTLAQLAELYQRETLIYSFKISECLILLVVSMALGWLSARLSVARHLQEIKPQ